jgi:hypothetical protein
MAKRILVSLAILTLATSAAVAAQRTHPSRAMKPNASTAAMNQNAFARVGPSPVVWQGGVSNSDRALYIKNLHDSGWNPKNDFNANGTIKTQ